VHSGDSCFLTGSLAIEQGRGSAWLHGFAHDPSGIRNFSLTVESKLLHALLTSLAMNPSYIGALRGAGTSGG
jgi:hypothetical protein